MNSKITLLLFCLSLLSLNSYFSQIDIKNTRDGEKVEYCLQHKKLQELKQNPDFLKQYLKDQEVLKLAEEQIKSGNSTHQRGTVYKIPIVFHVLHNGGDENISNAQIIDAVEVLNRDYRLLNADANNVVFDFNASNPNAVAVPADIEVEFVLATKAPDGTCFSGITRTQSSLSFVESSNQGYNQVNAIKTGNDVYQGEWPGNKYLNVFVCGNIGGAAGYTNKPNNWAGTAMTNGIWILHDYVGRIGTGQVGRDRAMTHEIGHWLNLDHTWGGNNNPGNASSCSTDDGVADTPNTIGVTACILGENTCGPKANVENYMDYSYCSKMYTEGQRDKMQAALNSSVGGRNNIWTTANLVSTGADGNTYLCAADFYANRLKICAGDSIQFFDNSYNNVTTWSWTFTGAVTSSSNEQNPVIIYNTPGVYSVTLTVSDGSTTLTKTSTQYITVTGLGEQLPFLDGFENYTNLTSSGYWDIDNQQNNATFQITTSASHTGSKSVVLNNFGQSGSNVDELLANPVDLSGVTSSSDVTLSFRFSYRKRVSTNLEKLYVLFSGNCGDSWEIRKSLQGSSLSSVIESNAWVPADQADWTTVHLTNITSSYWNQNFRYKFRFEGNGGNNLYLDNINIYASGPSDSLIGSGSQANINEMNLTNSFMIYPNPTEGDLNISFKVDQDVRADVKIINLLGKTLSHQSIHSLAGNNLVVLSTENLASGTYLVQISINGQTLNKQFQVK